MRERERAFVCVCCINIKYRVYKNLILRELLHKLGVSEGVKTTHKFYLVNTLPRTQLSTKVIYIKEYFL